MNSWYALRSKPTRERVLLEQVSGLGFEAYCPRMVVRPINPRARKSKAYFPGYLFVRADLCQTSESIFNWMPESLGLVSFCGEPASVPDELVLNIRKTLEHLRHNPDPISGLITGDPVLIKDGPFSRYRALFDVRLSGGDRVRVLLQLLGDRSIPLELSSNKIVLTKHSESLAW
jgi:transcription antitermination factor NusG